MHAHEVHAYEMHAYEVHAHEMHACNIHAYEIHANDICAHEMMPIRYTLMRHMPREMHACICKMHVYEIYAAVGAHLGGTYLGDVLLALASLLPTIPMS